MKRLPMGMHILMIYIEMYCVCIERLIYITSLPYRQVPVLIALLLFSVHPDNTWQLLVVVKGQLCFLRRWPS